MSAKATFVFDIWYFAGLSTDAPFSAGCIKDGTVECPYHGWRFGIDDGACKKIPALTSDHPMETEKIKVRIFPAREDGQLIWVYIASRASEALPWPHTRQALIASPISSSAENP